MRYAVFLRGVNVGAHNRMKMAEFKHALEKLGLSRVETYIQSGNAAFDSEKTGEALGSEIRAALENLDVKADAIVRTADEMRAIVANLPFSDAEITAAARDAWESLYVVLFPSAPDGAKISPDANDRAVFRGREAYLLLGQSIRLSKLAARVMKMDAAATARNFHTIQKLAEMTAE